MRLESPIQISSTFKGLLVFCQSLLFLMDKDSPTDSFKPDSSRGQKTVENSSGFAAFWAELKRRKVMRVAITYAVVAWLVIQIAATTFEGFGIPEWAFRFVVIMLGLFFPVAVVLAWAFELTPEGIKTTKHAREGQGDTPITDTQEKKRNWFSLLFATAVPTIIFGALAIYFYATRSASPDPTSHVSSPAPHQVEDLDKSIAVLPLENLSPDPDNAFFAGGVQEDILTNLSRIRDLRVISRTSTLDYTGENRKKSNEIGSELNVRYLVEGSVRRAGNQVRVTVQLINAPRDEHIWAENYDYTLDNIFAIQSEIAQAIASQIQATISPEELKQLDHRPTRSQEAYDLYLKSRDIDLASAALRMGLDRMNEAIEYMEQALRIDPQFALAQAYLVRWYSLKHWFYADQYPDALDKARSHLERAKAMDTPQAELHLSQGYYYYWGFLDYARAAQEFASALSIQPNMAEALYGLALIQIRQNQREETLNSLERGLALDPRSPDLLFLLQISYASFRRYSEAAVMANRLADLDPDNKRFQFHKQGIRFFRTGDLSSYAEFLKQRDEISWQTDPDSPHSRPIKSRLDLLPFRLALYKGQFSEALAWLQSANFDPEIPAYERHHASATTHWLTGDQENAKQEAERAIDVGGWYLENNRPVIWLISREHARIALNYAILGDHENTEHHQTMAMEILRGTREEYMRRDETTRRLLPSYLVSGETESALELLDELLSHPGDVHAQQIRVDPFWLSFHGDARFEAILANAAPVEE